METRTAAGLLLILGTLPHLLLSSQCGCARRVRQGVHSFGEGGIPFSDPQECGWLLALLGLNEEEGWIVFVAVGARMTHYFNKNLGVLRPRACSESSKVQGPWSLNIYIFVNFCFI